MTAWDHRALRELLGAYVLGHLDEDEAGPLRAHLDGCAACRAELVDLQPVAALLEEVDPDHFETPPHPPAALGDRIRAQAAAASRDRPRPRPVLARRGVALRIGAVAAALVVAASLGGAVGRASAPDPPPAATPAPVPMEPVDLRAAAGVSVASATLVPHTWGVEIRIVAEGFAEGERFRAAFRDEQGRLTPAGEFIGTGAATMTCNLQSAVLRDDVTEVLVTDSAGERVLAANL